MLITIQLATPFDSKEPSSLQSLRVWRTFNFVECLTLTYIRLYRAFSLMTFQLLWAFDSNDLSSLTTFRLIGAFDFDEPSSHLSSLIPIPSCPAQVAHIRNAHINLRNKFGERNEPISGDLSTYNLSQGRESWGCIGCLQRPRQHNTLWIVDSPYEKASVSPEYLSLS